MTYLLTFPRNKFSLITFVQLNLAAIIARNLDKIPLKNNSKIKFNKLYALNIYCSSLLKKYRYYYFFAEAVIIQFLILEKNPNRKRATL